jgi:hypothetical protein
LKPVSRKVFDKMKKLGLIKFDKYERNNQITSKKKKGKRKRYYVEEPLYFSYLNIIG